MSRPIAGALLIAALLAALLRAQQDRSFRSEEQVTAIDLAISLDPPRALRRLAGPPGAAELRVVLDGRDPSGGRARSRRRRTGARRPGPSCSTSTWRCPTGPRPRGRPTCSPTTWPSSPASGRSSWWSPTRAADGGGPDARRRGHRRRCSRAWSSFRRPRTRWSRRGSPRIGHEPTARTSKSTAIGPGPPKRRRSTRGAEPGALERGLVTDRLDRMLLAAVDRSAGAEPRRAIFLATGGYEAGRGDRPLHRLTTVGDPRRLRLDGHPPARAPALGHRAGASHRQMALPQAGARTRPGRRSSCRHPRAGAGPGEGAGLPRAGQGAPSPGRAGRSWPGSPPGDDPLRRRSADGEPSRPRRSSCWRRSTTPRAGASSRAGPTCAPPPATRKSLADHPEVAAAVRRPEAALQPPRVGDSRPRRTLARRTGSRRSRHSTAGPWRRPALRSAGRATCTQYASSDSDAAPHRSPVVRVALRFGTSSGGRRSAGPLPARRPPAGRRATGHSHAAGSPARGDGRDPRWHSAPTPPSLATIPRSASLRATLAVPGEEGETRIIPFAPEPLDPAPTSPWGWTLRRPIQAAGRVEWGVVVVDELVGGAWGAALAQDGAPGIPTAGSGG